MLQVRSLQDVVLEKEAGLATREKQLVQDLEESRAGERCLRDSLHVLEAEMSELNLRLCSTENRAKALATECQQADSAHREARSQLDKLRLVLHRMICDSRDLVTGSSGKCGGLGEHVSRARTGEQAEGGVVLCNPDVIDSSFRCRLTQALGSLESLTSLQRDKSMFAHGEMGSIKME